MGVRGPGEAGQATARVRFGMLPVMRSRLASPLVTRLGRRALSPLGFGLVLLASWGSAWADAWNAELATGQEITVDPSTNRPVIESKDGRSRQLWDGVHRLRDGSTITVERGIMVPNEEVSTLRRPPPERMEEADDEKAAAETAPEHGAEDGENCDRLVLKTCGLNKACEADEPCTLSRQLRSMQGHPGDRPAGGNLGWSEQRCRESLENESEFPACDKEPPLETVACGHLRDHVCGSTQRCAGSSSCLLARELSDLEDQALDREDPQQVARVRQQCQQILADHAFFPPCR